MTESRFTEQRRLFHEGLFDKLLTVDKAGVPSNADKDQKTSVALATMVIKELGCEPRVEKRLPGQSSGNVFESACLDFLAATFPSLDHLRPGNWGIEKVTTRNRLEIAKYDQYTHLIDIDNIAAANPELQAAIGSDYTITPDVVIYRNTESDETINDKESLVDTRSVRHACLRKKNNVVPLLHASISCKWTIRSDRAQNSRTEALNLVRNRKGHLPHVVVVTGEPTPSRLASIALGTGDIDCVYHFALYELQRAVEQLDNDEATNLLNIMVSGKRIKDVSDLPMDLAV